MATDPAALTPGTGFSEGFSSALEEGERAQAGIGPYRLALRRLRRNRIALAFGAMFLVIVVLCLFAPYYSHHIAHTGPNDNHVTDTVKVGGKVTDVVSPIGIPIGPTWHSRYFLGADANGRDVAVRLLYGGRNSLEIGLAASLHHARAGHHHRPRGGLLSRLGGRDHLAHARRDLVLSGPAAGRGAGHVAVAGRAGPRPVHDQGRVAGRADPRDRRGLRALCGQAAARAGAGPARARVRGRRARALGHSSPRIIFSEILPNVLSTIVVFVPLVVANAILLEAGLSFLGAGVQDPNPSWGTMIADGIHQIPAAIHQTLVPGLMLVLTVLGINVFGDGVRDAIDPRATVRIEH